MIELIDAPQSTSLRLSSKTNYSKDESKEKGDEEKKGEDSAQLTSSRSFVDRLKAFYAK
jgi:hypothetical protein